MGRKKCLKSITVFLVLSLIFFGGCAKEEEPLQEFVVPEQEFNMEYIRYDYSIPVELLIDERYSVCRNITGTGMLQEDWLMAGYRVLESYGEYVDLMELIESQRARGRVGCEIVVSDATGTPGLTIDEVFFGEHDLLLLDLCMYGAIRELQAEPVVTEIGDGQVAIDFYCGGTISSTAGNSGVLYLIALPCDFYTDVDINWIQVEEWMEYHNPTPF